MKSSEVEIESTLTRKQYMILNLLITLRKNSFFLILTIFLVFLTAYGMLAEERTIRPAIVFLILTIVFYAIIFLFMGMTNKNRNFFLPSVYTINDEYVKEKTSISENMYKWDVFVKWEKVAGFYILYLSRLTLLTIPATNIRTSDLPAFTHLLEKNIGAPSGRIWSWKMRGALYIAIVISLLFLFMTFAIYKWIEGSLFEIIGPIIFIVVAILFVIEFFLLARGKKTGSRTMVNISAGLLSLTMIVSLFIILDVHFFNIIM